jgi:transcriptional regulator with GAF, ATPase, and Fis domain
MQDLPSRTALAALRETVSAVVPAAAIGFARRLPDGRVSVLYSSSQGLTLHIADSPDVPELLQPSTPGILQTNIDATDANALRAVEWQLRFIGVHRLLSVRVPGFEPATRFWIGLPSPNPLTLGQVEALEALAVTSVQVLTSPVSKQETDERLRRLELAAELLPALLHVLDVREVFDRLSTTANRALPHDVLLLRRFNDDLSTVAVFARSDRGSDVGTSVSVGYPPQALQAWQFSIIDDLKARALDADAPLVERGARSALRLSIRFDDRLIAGLAFLSFEPGKYTTTDVIVGRRLAEHVANALSHFALAERLAEQARRTEELRSRTTNLDLLDALLVALVDSGDVRDVFGRISSTTQKVLAHDAALLMVRLADGRHARLYASSGFPPPLPETTEIPDEILQNPGWEHHIFDDLTQVGSSRYARLAELGFRSLIRVPIRLDGQFAGALVFLSKALAKFADPDIAIARRVADRLAVTLARDRELDASRRADEATERAIQLEARVRALTDELDARTGYRRVVGESASWRQVLTQATQVAATATTVLLLGESGTGKEVVARFLHRGSSRKSGPFIALNCAALPEQLLEAELFGYERGAFTGAMQSKPGQLEQAAGGTLFLDEVGEMSPSAQAKFLRVLQEREFQRLGGTRVLRTDARVVAATNRNLERAIANGLFREDLYYRLNVFAIRLPPLRDRRDDILPLSEAFVGEIGRNLGRPPAGISRDARQMLIDYRWPGNVRELRNILERAAILCDGGLIAAEHLALDVSAAPRAVSFQEPASSPAPLPAPAAVAPSSPDAQPTSAAELQTMERAMIEQALQAARFNKSKAAKALGLSRRQLYIRMRRYGFD